MDSAKDSQPKPGSDDQPDLAFNLAPEKLKKLQQLADKSDLTLSSYISKVLSKAIETEDVFSRELKKRSEEEERS